MSLFARPRHSLSLLSLSDDILLQVLEYFVHPNGIDIDSFLSFQLTSSKCLSICNKHELWNSIPLFLRNKSLNFNRFHNMGKSQFIILLAQFYDK